MREGGGGDHDIVPGCWLGRFFVGTSDCLPSETPHSSGTSWASESCCHPWVFAGEVTLRALGRRPPAAPGSECSQLPQRAGCSPHSGPALPPPSQAAQNRWRQLWAGVKFTLSVWFLRCICWRVHFLESQERKQPLCWLGGVREPPSPEQQGVRGQLGRGQPDATPHPYDTQTWCDVSISSPPDLSSPFLLSLEAYDMVVCTHRADGSRKPQCLLVGLTPSRAVITECRWYSVVGRKEVWHCH